MPANNNLFQKNANTSMVAQLIWKQQGVSRIEISRELSLYKSTVSNIITNLLASDFVYEGSRKDSNSQGGRKAIGLYINREFGCTLGFDLQPSHYRSVIVSVDGSTVWEEKGSVGAVSFEEMVISVIDRALEAQKKIGLPVLSLSFSIPGSIDCRNGKILVSNPFGIKDYDFKSFVESRYPYPVYVENDANCAAWFDLQKNLGAKSASNAFTVVADYHEESRCKEETTGIGVGTGLIIDGKVYRGTHNGAGEFCSISWSEKDPGNQTGLSKEILRSTLDNKESLAVWLEDTFRSYMTILSVIDVEKVILHGNPFSDEEWVRATLMERVPAFAAMLEKTECELVFDADDESVSALGAAYMYLMELYSVPKLEEDVTGRKSWEEIIDFSRKQRT